MLNLKRNKASPKLKNEPITNEVERKAAIMLISPNLVN